MSNSNDEFLPENEKNNKNRVSTKKNTILNMIKTLSTIVFPLITFPYISRVLGVSNVGIYNFSNTFVSYFSLLASLGIYTYAVRECSLVKDNREKLNKIGSQLLSLNIITCVLSYVFLAISLLFIRSLDNYRICIIIISSSLIFNTIGCEWINTAFEDFKYITIRSVIIQLLALILMFVFIRKPEDYLIYAGIATISSCGSNLLNVFYRKKYCSLSFTFNLNLKRNLPPILLLFALSLAQTIFSSSDITIIGFIKGDYYVGLYSTAVKVFNIILQVLASIVWVLLPKLTQAFSKENYEIVNNLLDKALAFLIGLGLPCVAGIALLSEEVLYLIGGDLYLDAKWTLIILMFSCSINLVGSSFLGNLIILPSGKDKVFLLSCVIAAIINIALNLIFIPIYGIEAAATSTLVSYFIIFFILLIFIDKNIKIFALYKKIIKPLIATIIMLACGFFLKKVTDYIYIKLLITIFGCMIIYFIVLYILKYNYLLEYSKKILLKIRGKK